MCRASETLLAIVAARIAALIVNETPLTPFSSSISPSLYRTGFVSHWQFKLVGGYPLQLLFILALVVFTAAIEFVAVCVNVITK